MRWVEPTMNAITRAAGHPLMLPCGLAFIGTLYWWFGVDAANFCLSLLTFALLPILQHSSNRDGLALQAKLDELIRASDARNDFIGLDLQTEKDIERRRRDDD